MNYPDQKFKNDAQRKQFLLKRDIRLQKDEHGVEGVAIARDGAGEEEKEIKVGKRLSANRIRQEDWGDGAGSREQRETAFGKMNANLRVHGNTQAGRLLQCVM